MGLKKKANIVGSIDSVRLFLATIYLFFQIMTLQVRTIATLMVFAFYYVGPVAAYMHAKHKHFKEVSVTLCLVVKAIALFLNVVACMLFIVL